MDHYIEFANIKGFGRFQRGKPRPIVARFIYQSDVSTVLERANWLRVDKGLVLYPSDIQCVVCTYYIKTILITIYMMRIVLKSWGKIF